MSIPVKIKRVHPDAVIPEYKTPGACAFDIAPIEDATIAPGQIVRLRTGLVFCVPEGHVMLAAARSSLPKKYGLCVPQSVGIIDNDFCGPEDEFLIQLLNFTNSPVQVKAGDRLIQCLLVPFVHAQFQEVTKLEAPNRGGYGSTG